MDNLILKVLQSIIPMMEKPKLSKPLNQYESIVLLPEKGQWVIRVCMYCDFFEIIVLKYHIL